MKPISTLLVLAGLALTGCLTARHGARVESDYSYRGNFQHYHTYGFLSGPGLSADTSRLGQTLREAIQQRLLVQGYRPSRRPDILVNFRVYVGDLKFRGFAQEELSAWLKANAPESEATPKADRQGYAPVRLVLAQGTLLLTFIDVKTNHAVWNGYASGVVVPQGPQGEVVLRRSVRSILDRYRVFTEDFANGTLPRTEGRDAGE